MKNDFCCRKCYRACLKNQKCGIQHEIRTVKAELDEKFGKRVFATAKKMGAETAEANINAGLAAASQIVDFLKNGNTRFQVNK